MKLFLIRYRSFVIIGLTLFAMIAAYWFGIRALGRSIVEQRDTIERGVAIAENREARVRRLDEYEQQSGHITENVDRFRIFVGKDDEVGFIGTLERLAREAGVTITFEERDGSDKLKKQPKVAVDETTEASVKQTAKKPVTIIGSLPSTEYFRVAIKTTGEYRAVMRFLEKVETLPFSTDVVEIDALKREREEEKKDAARPFVSGGDARSENGEELVLTLDLVVYREPVVKK
jgi:Tfp pilus assembly protein PilO